MKHDQWMDFAALAFLIAAALLPAIYLPTFPTRNELPMTTMVRAAQAEVEMKPVLSALSLFEARVYAPLERA